MHHSRLIILYFFCHSIPSAHIFYIPYRNSRRVAGCVQFQSNISILCINSTFCIFTVTLTRRLIIHFGSIFDVLKCLHFYLLSFSSLSGNFPLCSKCVYIYLIWYALNGKTSMDGKMFGIVCGSNVYYSIVIQDMMWTCVFHVANAYTNAFGICIPSNPMDVCIRTHIFFWNHFTNIPEHCSSIGCSIHINGKCCVKSVNHVCTLMLLFSRCSMVLRDEKLKAFVSHVSWIVEGKTN